MREFQQKKKFKKALYSPLMLVFMALVLALLAKGLYGVYEKEQVSAENLARQQSELDTLNQRQHDLTSSIDYLKTDAGVESEIRSKFRVVKDGESVAIIVNDDATTTAAAINAATTTIPTGFLASFKRWFGL